MPSVAINHLPSALIDIPVLPSHERPEDVARRDADLRALPLQRMMAYGAELGDALLIRRLVEEGADWTEAAVAVAERALALGSATLCEGSVVTRRETQRRAAASLRLAQLVCSQDDEERKRIFFRAAELFASSVAGDDRYQRIVVDHPRGPLYGWRVSAGTGPDQPEVLLFGGMEGWGEDHHEAAEALLARGIGSVLLDGPGQGMSRMRGGHYLNQDFVDGYRAVLEFMAARQGGLDRIAIWGNSMGGTFATHVASQVPGLAACVNNGGGANLAKLVDRWRTFEKMKTMCGPPGSVSDEQALEIFEAMTLRAGNIDVSCPVLIVHAGQDQLIEREDMVSIFDDAPVIDKALFTFEDSEHCIYRHPSDKYAVIADWLGARLGVG